MRSSVKGLATGIASGPCIGLHCRRLSFDRRSNFGIWSCPLTALPNAKMIKAQVGEIPDALSCDASRKAQDPDLTLADQVRQQAEGLIGQRGVDEWFLPLESLSALHWAVLVELGVNAIEICDRSRFRAGIEPCSNGWRKH